MLKIMIPYESWCEIFWLIALAVDPYIYDEQELTTLAMLAVARMAARDFLENPAKDPEGSYS